MQNPQVIGWFRTGDAWLSGTPNFEFHFHIPIRHQFFLLTSLQPWPLLKAPVQPRNAGCWKHVWGVWFKIWSQDGEQLMTPWISSCISVTKCSLCLSRSDLLVGGIVSVHPSVVDVPPLNFCVALVLRAYHTEYWAYDPHYRILKLYIGRPIAKMPMQCQEEDLPGPNLAETCHAMLVSTDAMSKSRHQQLLQSLPVNFCGPMVYPHKLVDHGSLWWLCNHTNIAVFHIHVSHGICFRW